MEIQKLKETDLDWLTDWLKVIQMPKQTAIRKD